MIENGGNKCWCDILSSHQLPPQVACLSLFSGVTPKLGNVTGVGQGGTGVVQSGGGGVMLDAVT